MPFNPALPLSALNNASSYGRKDKKSRDSKGKGFVHSVLSFTKLEVPEVELFETAATFAADTDPLTVHDALADVFGQKAGFGHFLFRADSSVSGRYWVRSMAPWTRWPEGANSALEPKRQVIQLAGGLMYRYTLAVCAGDEFMTSAGKRVQPYDSVDRVEAWFQQNAADFGFRLLFANVSLHALRFAHQGMRYKVPYAEIEGTLEVADADRLKRRLLKGFGSYRRTGLGMLQLSD